MGIRTTQQVRIDRWASTKIKPCRQEVLNYQEECEERDRDSDGDNRHQDDHNGLPSLPIFLQKLSLNRFIKIVK